MLPSVIDRLNETFYPAFSFDQDNYDQINWMWMNALASAELIQSELGLETQQDLEKYATDRVVDAWKVIFWGEQLASAH